MLQLFFTFGDRRANINFCLRLKIEDILDYLL